MRKLRFQVIETSYGPEKFLFNILNVCEKENWL